MDPSPPRESHDVGLALSNVPLNPFESSLDDPPRVRRKPIFNLTPEVLPDPRKPYGTRPDPNSLPLDDLQSSSRTPSPRYGVSFPKSALSSMSPPRPELLSASSFQSTFSESVTSGYNSDPNTRLLGSPSYFNTPDLRGPLQSHNTQITYSSARKRWYYSPWMMLFMWLLGSGGAVAHHAFYSHISGQEVHEQLNMSRYGGALAYFTKSFLAASVVLAFRQQIWATFRRKFLSVNAIDSLFSGITDLDAMLNLEVFKKAKAACFLLVLLWIAPFTVILAPATLLVVSTSETFNTTCPNARTLNFALEAANDWRKPYPSINNQPELTFSFWNNTTPNTTNPNFYDYYDQPSQPIVQLSTLSAYLQTTLVRKDASSDVCGAGWNCTYTTSFVGPGYKCQTFTDDDVTVDGATVADNTPPFNTSVLIPKGNFSYHVLAYEGDYVPIQMNGMGGGGVPPNLSSIPQHLGAFRTEPVIWGAQATLVNTTLKPPRFPKNATSPGYNNFTKSSLFYCEHYETNYTVTFNFTSGSQVINVTNRNFLWPVMNTTFVRGEDANDDTNDNTTAIPEENYVYPRDIDRYRRVAAFHSMGASLRRFINGTMESLNPNSPITYTQATQTRLIDPSTYLAYEELGTHIQSFYEDLILSLFSKPSFLAVVWATNTTAASGAQANLTASGLYPCTKTRTHNVFYYRAWDLWLIYGTMIFLSGIGLLLGVAAVSQNGGYMKDIRFSSIVAATRAPCLDTLEWKKGMGGGLGRQDVGAVRLGYGQVRGGGTPHMAGGTEASYRGFGFEGEVRQDFTVTGNKRQSVFSFGR